MVEVAPLAVERVGVGLGAVEALDEVGVALRLQQRDRVLLGVGVEVAEDQDVGVAGARRVLCQPVGEQAADLCAHGVAVAPGRRRCVGLVARAALALEVVGHPDEDAARDVVAEGLRERRTVARVLVTTGDEGLRVEHSGAPDRRHLARLVEHADLDRVVTEGVDLAAAGVGVDERPRARAVLVVEPVDEELHGAVGAVAVVLELHEGDDVGLRAGHRSNGLAPLPLELRRVVGSAAVGRCHLRHRSGSRRRC